MAALTTNFCTKQTWLFIIFSWLHFLNEINFRNSLDILCINDKTFLTHSKRFWHWKIKQCVTLHLFLSSWKSKHLFSWLHFLNAMNSNTSLGICRTNDKTVLMHSKRFWHWKIKNGIISIDRELKNCVVLKKLCGNESEKLWVRTNLNYKFKLFANEFVWILKNHTRQKQKNGEIWKLDTWFFDMLLLNIFFVTTANFSFPKATFSQQRLVFSVSTTFFRGDG